MDLTGLCFAEHPLFHLPTIIRRFSSNRPSRMELHRCYVDALRPQEGQVVRRGR